MGKKKVCVEGGDRVADGASSVSYKCRRDTLPDSS